MSTITDRELLELAAKAYLSALRWDVSKHAPVDDGGVPIHWNPLRTHAQAKELRHVLQLTTGFDQRFAALGPCAYATYKTGEYSCDSIMQNIEEAGGKKAALRRAIVRAAAEIERIRAKEAA